MPNGHDKNWVRLCGAIEGFRLRYGRWPTEVRIDPICLEDLRHYVFSERAWRVIENNLVFHAVGGAFEVTGHRESDTATWRRVFRRTYRMFVPEEWIGVTPDRH